MNKTKFMVVDAESTGKDWTTAVLHGVGIGYSEDEATYYPAWNIPANILADLANPRIAKIGHNIHGYDAKLLKRHGIQVAGELDDTMVIWNLIDDNTPLGLKWLVNKHLEEEDLDKKRALDRYVSLHKAGHIGGLCAQDLADPTRPHTKIIGEYCVEDCINTMRLFWLGIKRLQIMNAAVLKMGFKKGPLDYYKEEARPLERVLMEIEYKGIRVNLAVLEKIKAEALTRMSAIEGILNKVFVNRIPKVEQELYEKEVSKVTTEKAKSARKPGVGKCKFSWANGNHFGSLLYKFCELPPGLIQRTDKGAFQTDKTAIEIVRDGLRNTDKARLIKYLNLYSEYKKHIKIASTYTGDSSKGIMSKIRMIEGIPRIFPQFRQTTGTGRLACIAEGQQVQVPGGTKAIQDIKPGEYVYSYSADKTLTLRKVTAVIDNGIQECVRVKWQSSGDGRVGELICTPDHKIQSKYRGWVRADSLKHYDKVLHVRRETLTSGRVRLYSTNRGQELEESVIKREYFGASSSMHIHHIDENKSNNSLHNLAVVTNEGHQVLHSQARAWQTRDEKIRTPKTRFGLLKALARTKGRATFVRGDFQSFKNLCDAKNISIREVKRRYSANQTYLSRGAVLRSMELGDIHRASRFLGVGLMKLKQLCWKYEITYNHSILSVKSAGLRRVYDLSVEETENFIASEICVHNCSNPNTQNIKNDSEIKRLFIPDNTNEVFDESDYSQIELCTGAHVSKDSGLVDAYCKQEDVHIRTATRLFKTAIDSQRAKKKGTEDYVMRQAGKRTNFLTIFDGKAHRLQSSLKADTGRDFTIEECREFISAWFEIYPEFRAYLDSELEFFKTHKFCIAETGRVRRLPDIKFGKGIAWVPDKQQRGKRVPRYKGPTELRLELVASVKQKNPRLPTTKITEDLIGWEAHRRYSHAIKAGYNMPIQGLAASITKRSMVRLHNMGFNIVNQVHDSLIVSRDINDVAAKTKVIAVMENTYKIDVPVIVETQTLRSFHPKDEV